MTGQSSRTLYLNAIVINPNVYIRRDAVISMENSL
jgi:hypothetical protein